MASTWRGMGAPPYTAVLRVPRCLPSASISRLTCRASSRVGQRIRACTAETLRFTSESISGIANAAVLPVPVRACTTKSSPRTAGSNTARCTGVGCVYPSSSIARRSSLDRGSTSNVGGGASVSGVSVLIEQNLKEGRDLLARRLRTGFRKGLGLSAAAERAPLPHSARRAPPHSEARQSRRAPREPWRPADRRIRGWRGCSILGQAQHGSVPALLVHHRFRTLPPVERAALLPASRVLPLGILSPLSPP